MDIAERLKHGCLEETPMPDCCSGSSRTTRLCFCLAARGANANLRDQREQTLLFLAADRSKDQAIAKHLLARGADPGAGRVWPDAAARRRGLRDRGAPAVLLDGGAEIDAHDGTGCTPFHSASSLAGSKRRRSS